MGSVPTQSLLSRVNVVSDSFISWINTLYYVIGDELSVDSAQDTLTVDPSIAVCTEVGTAGMKALVRVKASDNSEYPTEFLASTFIS